jgi:hypothetical protein
VTDAEMKILLLWDHQRMDTWAISEMMHLHEWEVCKTLWRLRDERRCAKVAAAK